MTPLHDSPVPADLEALRHAIEVLKAKSGDGMVKDWQIIANAECALIRLRSRLKELEGGRDCEWLEQAWNEIYGTMHDTMLNNTQRRAFILSILKGQLANPTDAGGVV